MLSTLLVTGTSATSLARMLNLEGLFGDRRRPGCLDFSGDYPVGAQTVTMAQTGCDGEVLVGGHLHWTYTVDPATGVATSSRPGQGTATLVDGRVVWSNGNTWGELDNFDLPVDNGPAEVCSTDFTGTYTSQVNFVDVDIVQTGCDGEVFVDGHLHWTFHVDPATGIATSSRPDQGDGVLVGGTITWDNGHVWGNPSGGCTVLSQQPFFTNCVVDDYSRRTLLGDWRTESCEAQCERFLNGREGCCTQKNNKALCWAFVGGRTENVKVQPGSVGSVQSIECNQPDYDGDEYKMSDISLNCAPGYEIIDNLDECLLANDLLNVGWFRSTHLETTGQATRVGGCFKQETGYWKLNGNVMFNKNLAGVNGGSYNGDRRICRKATASSNDDRVCPPPTHSDARGRGCPAPAPGMSMSSTCIDSNRPYDTLADAWAACAEFPECDTITEWGPDMPLGETKFRLRRHTDPTHVAGTPCGYANCEGAGYTFTC